MERLSRAERVVIAAALLLAAGLILYNAFDTQPLSPVLETLAASDAVLPAPAATAPEAEPAPAQPPPRETQAQKPPAAPEKPAGPINLNTATREELMTLSGIGEVKADAILAYRAENGAFQSVEQLLEVSGIGEKTLEKLRAHVCV